MCGESKTWSRMANNFNQPRARKQSRRSHMLNLVNNSCLSTLKLKLSITLAPDCRPCMAYSCAPTTNWYLNRLIRDSCNSRQWPMTNLNFLRLQKYYRTSQSNSARFTKLKAIQISQDRGKTHTLTLSLFRKMGVATNLYAVTSLNATS